MPVNNYYNAIHKGHGSRNPLLAAAAKAKVAIPTPEPAVITAVLNPLARLGIRGRSRQSRRNRSRSRQSRRNRR